jgi:hypothetical protein
MITIVGQLSSDGSSHGVEHEPLIARQISYWHEVDIVPADRTTSVALALESANRAFSNTPYVWQYSSRLDEH